MPQDSSPYNSVHRGRSNLHPRKARWALELPLETSMGDHPASGRFREAIMKHPPALCPIGSFCIIGKPRLIHKLWENNKLWSDILCLWNWDKEEHSLGRSHKRRDLLGFSFSPHRKLLGEPSVTSVLGPWILSSGNPMALELQLEILGTPNSHTGLHTGKPQS